MSRRQRLREIVVALVILVPGCKDAPPPPPQPAVSSAEPQTTASAKPAQRPPSLPGDPPPMKPQKVPLAIGKYMMLLTPKLSKEIVGERLKAATGASEIGDDVVRGTYKKDGYDMKLTFKFEKGGTLARFVLEAATRDACKTGELLERWLKIGQAKPTVTDNGKTYWHAGWYFEIHEEPYRFTGTAL